jgi:hypothetical protein
MSSIINQIEDKVSACELCSGKEQLRGTEVTQADECGNTVCGNCATAIGCSTKAFGDCSASEGTGTKAYGNSSHSEGNSTTANGDSSHAEGCSTIAYGNCSHTEGASTNAFSDYSHAEGYNTKTRGSYSHTEGYSTVTNNTFGHAEGYNTQANGYASHAEGSNSTSKLDYSHAEGYNTAANYYYSHTEGYNTKADGYAAHAEGYYTSAPGSYSHAEGNNTTANASYSHAQGSYTNTKNATGSVIMGIYGDADTPYSWFLGGGTSDSDRSLAAKILYTGDAYIKNSWNAGGSGYAEMFRSQCQAIDAGYFVTLKEDMLQPVSCREDYVLGVTTSAPGFVANSFALKTSSVNLGTSQSTLAVEDVIQPEVRDHEGKLVASEKKLPANVAGAAAGAAARAGSAVQYSDSGSYWTAVTLLGQVVVFDDGTCRPNHYCLPDGDGIATAADHGYRVMKRLCENQVLILFR